MTSSEHAFDALLEALRSAGREELLPRFHGHLAVSEKADGSLVTSADHAVDRRLRETLEQLYPGIPVLSEEQPRDAQQAALEGNGPCWLLDPLDGTTNFAGGMPFFAISLALIDTGGVAYGATYDPIRDELFTVARGTGLRLNGEAPASRPPESADLSRCTALVDYKRLSHRLALALVTEPPFRSQRNLGACALEWAWLAAGRADLYLHGGQALWDSAAGTLMLTESGGRQCTLEGDPVFRRSLQKPSAVAARSPALQDAWLGWLKTSA
ncbi:MAG: inositol monophosphatase family protein [Thioalkalivibrio sp.]|nr:inositol monophosphatase family protein [Thioalkalivibrio sp.]